MLGVVDIVDNDGIIDSIAYYQDLLRNVDVVFVTRLASGKFLTVFITVNHNGYACGDNLVPTEEFHCLISGELIEP